jgi:hypothetical protein
MLASKGMASMRKSWKIDQLIQKVLGEGYTQGYHNIKPYFSLQKKKDRL